MYWNCLPPPPPQVLVDAPDRVRGVANLKRITLTDFKLDIPRLARKKVLTGEFNKAGRCLSRAAASRNKMLASTMPSQIWNFMLWESELVCDGLLRAWRLWPEHR